MSGAGDEELDRAVAPEEARAQAESNRRLLSAALAQLRDGRDAAASLYRALEEASRLAGALSVCAPESAELPEVVEQAAQLAVALFEVSSAAPGTSMQIAVGEPSWVPATGAGANGWADVATWRRGLYLALVAGRTDLAEALARTTPELLAASSTTASAYQHLFAATLRALVLDEADVYQRLHATLPATDPALLDDDDRRYALLLVVPEARLALRLLDEDEAGFAVALREAIIEHKRYWGAAPKGWLALGPLAFAALARRRGWTLGVTSPYLPPALLAVTA